MFTSDLFLILEVFSAHLAKPQQKSQVSTTVVCWGTDSLIRKIGGSKGLLST